MGSVFSNLDWSVLSNVLISVIPALICITFHELSHGYVAYRLGDDTAKRMGRLTLNPIRHIDIFGLLMMVVFRFGWAKPVPVNMMNFKRPKRYMAITALAGPMSNLLLAAIMMVIFGLAITPLGGVYVDGAGGVEFAKNFSGAVLNIIFLTAYISVALAVFNFIPIPPLDGSKVLFSLVSDSAYFKLMRYERYGMIILVVLLSTNVLDSTIGRGTSVLFGWILNIAGAVFRLVN